MSAAPRKTARQIVFEEAQRAFAQGRSLIPIGLDKRPSFSLLPLNPETSRPTWKPFQSRYATPEEQSRWMSANPPAFAFVTGSLSGIVTFDFDGEEGVKLAETWRIQPHRSTGSGGRHWDVRWPGFYVPTLNRKALREMQKLWPGLDIKGDGGYAVFTGRSQYGIYQWLREPEPDEPTLVPPHVWEFLRSRTAGDIADLETDTTGGEKVHRGFSNRVDSEVLIRQALKEARSGRNNAGFGLACQCRDNDYSRSETLDVLHRFRAQCPKTNTKGISECYSDSEIHATLESVFSHPARDRWSAKDSVSRGGVQKKHP